MRGGLVALLLILLPGLSHAQPAPPTASSGTLTILVRDAAGHPLGGIDITLLHDTDLDGLVPVGAQATDPAGRVTYLDLPWGLYVVQLVGQLPDGTPIQSVTLQNSVPRDDGGMLPAGGFGVRFVEATRTERLVLTAPAGGVAVPLFDLAPDDIAPPQPYDPALHILPTPTPFAVADVAAGRLDAGGRPIVRTRGARDGWWLALTGLALGSMTMLLLVGWLRSRRAAKGASDA